MLPAPNPHDIDFGKYGYANNVWEAVKLCRDTILDHQQFDRALDALESLLIPSMKNEEREQLQEIKEKGNEILLCLVELKNKVTWEIEQSNDILRGDQEVTKIENMIANATYEFNLQRYKLLVMVAHRIFVRRETATFADYDLEKDVSDVYNKYLCYIQSEESR